MHTQQAQASQQVRLTGPHNQSVPEVKVNHLHVQVLPTHAVCQATRANTFETRLSATPSIGVLGLTIRTSRQSQTQGECALHADPRITSDREVVSA